MSQRARWKAFPRRLKKLIQTKTLATHLPIRREMKIQRKIFKIKRLLLFDFFLDYYFETFMNA